MDSSEHVRWIILFKKFSSFRVNGTFGLSFTDMNDRRVVYVDGKNLISVNIATSPQKRTLVEAYTAITGDLY